METQARPPSPKGVTSDPGVIRTFLIADLRGYTRFTDERGDEAAPLLTEEFVAAATRHVEARSGRVVEVRGDEVLAVFDSAREAIRAAVALQAALSGKAAESPELPFAAGVGLDAGEAVPVANGFRGRALNLAARLCARARPGEILITPELAHLAGSVEGIRFEDRGAVRLKGLSQPTNLISVSASSGEQAPASRPPAGHVSFRLLGPLHVSEGGREVPLGGPRQRLVLAHLLLAANRVVTTEELIERVWGSERPSAARGTIKSYISHLRRALGADRIEGGSSGYQLRAEIDEVDVLQFEQLLRRARRLLPVDPRWAGTTFSEALELWRGPALGDLADAPSLAGEVARIEALRLGAVEDMLDARLTVGDHADALPDLERLTHEHPLRERLWAMLMLARYRSGRQTEALEAYRRARELLADEFGIDPWPNVQALHERILRQDPALEVAGRPLRGYRLLEKIGEGAFGMVWRATDEGVGRDIAVKQIHPRFADDPTFVRRFDHEAQTIARLEHPHVVPLYDYWRDGSGAYLVMRWMRGGSVEDALDGRGVDADNAIRMVGQVASALSAAHRLQILHRDVKPANVLLDDDGNAYLSDFGIAEDLTDWREVLPASSLGYRSPEQLRGEEATASSDIYGLGMVAQALLERRANPPAVRDVLTRATADDPQGRYPDALEFAEALQGAFGLAPAGRRTVSMEERNPYKGLRPFTEADADDFFGRDALVDELVVRLAESGEGCRFLAVVGPSGSGKSSVVRAGLVPALRRGALEGSDRWFYAEMLPGAHPLEELGAALQRVAVRPVPSLPERLERDPYELAASVRSLLPPDDGELVLVIDQLEEVFTLVEHEQERARFLAALVAAVSGPRTRLRVVATLRADFFDRPLAYPRVAELMRVRSETIVPLSAEELEQAIVGPAEQVGVLPERALVAEMIADVSEHPGALPLMQYALTELFERRRDGVLTLEAYRAIEGIAGALARRAEELYESFTEPEREAAKQLLLRLVTPGDGVADSRRLVPRTELGSVEVDARAMDVAIDTFGRHRLLSFDRDPATRGATIEVAHEALLRSWERLRRWIDDARDDLRAHGRIAAAAAEWEAGGRDPSFLLRGSRLDRAEAWTASTTIALARVEREYLGASLHLRHAELAEERARRDRERRLERRSVRRMRALVAILGAGVIVAATLTAIATDQRGRAERSADAAAAERDRAERAARETLAREIALAADANLDEDPELSVLLALEAVETTRRVDGVVLREAEAALHRAVQGQRVTATIAGIGGAVYLADGERLIGYVPAGTYLTAEDAAANEAARTAWIIDEATGERLRPLEGHTDNVTDVAAAPATDLVATSSLDGTTRIWDPDSGAVLQMLRAEAGAPVLQVEFSRDGRWLATGAGREGRGAVTVWDRETWRPVSTLGPHRGGVKSMGWSGDGDQIAVVPAAEKTAGSWIAFKAWDVESGALLHTAFEPSSVFGIPFSEQLTDAVVWQPGRDVVLSAAGSGTVDAWDVARGERVTTTLVSSTRTAALTDITMSRDGSLLATGERDGTLTIWEPTPDGPRQVLELAGGPATIARVEFSPDGSRVAVGGEDGSTRVWDVSVQGGREWLTLPASTYVPDVDFSPDGARIAVSGRDVAIAIHDASDGRVVDTLTFDPADAGHPEVVGAFDLDFSPDGDRIAGAIGDSSLVWDLSTSAPPTRLGPMVGLANGVDFSSDGRQVVTTNWDPAFGYEQAETDTLRVWDARTGDEVWRQTNYIGIRPRMGPGNLVSTAGSDGTVRLWDAGSGEPARTLIDIDAFSTSTAFSPDGGLVAAGLQDGTARVWEVDTGRQLRSFRGGNTYAVAFDPGGARLATGHTNGDVKLWDLNTGEELLVLSGHVGEVINLAFSPDGELLASAGYDGTVRVWVVDIDELVEMARSRVTRALTSDECEQHLHVASCPPS